MLWLIQLLLPLTLLLWLAFLPARHTPGRIFQSAGTAAILLALHLAGLWILPPWWTPWIYWGLCVAALWRGWRIRTRPGIAVADYALIIFWAGMVGFGGWVSGQALRARMPPPGEIAALASPLAPGRYYVANGGSLESKFSPADLATRHHRPARLLGAKSCCRYHGDGPLGPGGQRNNHGACPVRRTRGSRA